MKKIFFVLTTAAIVTSASAITSSNQSLTAFGNFLATVTRPIIGENRASIFFVPTISVNELKGRYATAAQVSSAPKVNVLIMPGHEPQYGGAEYVGPSGLIRERDMTVTLAQDLAQFLRDNAHYTVTVPRDTHNWSPTFDAYFKNNWEAIKAFIKTQSQTMTQLVKSGQFKRQTETAKVYHNTVPSDVAVRIYGINKWANENNINIAIHIHFNDDPDHSERRAGDYSGFAIYVPEKQYSNSSTTKAIADAVQKRLTRYYPISNMPKESSGIVEDQDLIAIGSHNSVDAPSMLIEYGYIYEPGLQDPVTRETLLKDMAFQTYLGLQDFFESGNDVTLQYDSLLLPHKWTQVISPKTKNVTQDILALQTALMHEGLYPPEGETLTTCPRTGGFGSCTKRALTQFQNKYGITGETGVLGEATRHKLNELFEIQVL
jgi:N-acetylmuramoyl-L-alanine amidase